MSYGRKNAMLVGSVIGFVGVGIEMIESYWLIVLGRIIYGAGAGVYSVCTSRYLEELVPNHLLSTLLPVYICGTSMAKLVVVMTALGLPDDNDA